MEIAFGLAAYAFLAILSGKIADRYVLPPESAGDRPGDRDNIMVVSALLFPLALLVLIFLKASDAILTVADPALRLARRQARLERRHAREILSQTHRTEMAELRAREIVALETAAGASND